MKIKNMIGALQLDKKKQESHQLYTVWGENIDKEHVLEEYPRPQLRRKQYAILNGIFQYAICKDKKRPAQFDGDILVPFSPECALSGVNRRLQPDEYLWYERKIFIEEIIPAQRLILHFGAVDERCKVYINGQEAGGHVGGYQAFWLDITPFIECGENVLTVRVRDESDTAYHGRGKQKLKNGGMFYTAQSGIWQTVWMEWVPLVYVERLYLRPYYDENKVGVTIQTNQKRACKCHIVIYEIDQCIAEFTGETSGTEIKLDIPDKKSWSPARPFLYTLKIEVGEDEIESYFGMRLFSIEKDCDGIARLCLNHVPFFQNGILDQGYWPESLLTPPADEAMIHDIMIAKQLGFQMIRKHCKIEPMRWYYHCDRLGMLVWQDMINGGSAYRLLLTAYLPTVFPLLRKIKDNQYWYLARNEKKGRIEWKRECIETIEQLYNCTSVCTWVLFNEGWGQFDALKNTKLVMQKDCTRYIDAHSGWFDQNAGDLRSVHIYFSDLKVEKSSKPYVISEYGGLTYGIKGHTYSESYFGYDSYTNQKAYAHAYEKINQQAIMLKHEGLSAAVYTQLTDIEEETNGVLTYDRKIIKVNQKSAL